MVFEVINNPAFFQPSGFTKAQFRKLDQLYCMAASDKSLTYRTVECDFDEGVAVYTYYKSENHAPYLQFIIRKISHKTTMFELFKQGKGRIAKSGVFDKICERLCSEVDALMK